MSTVVEQPSRGGHNGAGPALGLMRAVLEAVGDGVVAVDAQGRITLFNEAAERLLGTGPLDVDPLDWPAVYGFRQPDGVPYPFERLPLARAMRGEVVRDEPLLVSRPGDGVAVSLRVSAWPLPGPMGRRGGAVAVFGEPVSEAGPVLPASDRGRVDAATYIALHEVARQFLSEAALDRLSALVAEQARSLLGGDDAALALVDERDGSLRFAGHTSGATGGRLSPSGGAARTAITRGRPVVLEDYRPTASGHPRRHRSLVAVPVCGPGLSGALAVFSRRRRLFTPDEVRLLTLVADLAGPALAAARRLARATASERRLRDLHAGVGFGVLVVDREGVIVERNEGAARICGVPEAALRGPLSIRLADPRDGSGHPIDYEDRPEQLALARGSAVPERAINYRCPDGRRRRLLTRCALVPGPEGERQAVLSFVDVTGFEEAERKLARSQAELDRVLGNAPVVLFTVDRREVVTFIRGRALDLAGTSSMALAGNTVGELFPENRLLQEHVRRALEGRTGTASVSLLGLVNDVLDTAKIEAGQMELRVAPVEVLEVAQQVADEMRPLASAGRLEMHVEVPPGLRVRADRRRFAQAVRNLLSNAVRFTDPGGAVWLVARSDGASVVLEVRDTGIGIPAGYLDRIFEEFGRVPDTSREGAGLGLPLTRSLLRLMGGTVEVRSRIGRGSTFTVRLPAA